MSHVIEDLSTDSALQAHPARVVPALSSSSDLYSSSSAPHLRPTAFPALPSAGARLAAVHPRPLLQLVRICVRRPTASSAARHPALRLLL